MVDKRPQESQESLHSGEMSDERFRIGDEHFSPSPISLLDTHIDKNIGSRLGDRKIEVLELDIAQGIHMTKAFRRGSAAAFAGISYPLAVMADSMKVRSGNTYLLCEAHLKIDGQDIVFDASEPYDADAIKGDDPMKSPAYTGPLRGVIDKCNNEAIKQIALVLH